MKPAEEKQQDNDHEEGVVNYAYKRGEQFLALSYLI
jgi:hypothetical protein